VQVLARFVQRKRAGRLGGLKTAAYYRALDAARPTPRRRRGSPGRGTRRKPATRVARSFASPPCPPHTPPLTPQVQTQDRAMRRALAATTENPRLTTKLAIEAQRMFPSLPPSEHRERLAMRLAGLRVAYTGPELHQALFVAEVVCRREQTRPQVTAGAASDRRRPQEEPMSRHFDLDAEARKMLAEVERRYGVKPLESVQPPPAPKPPAPYTPTATDPPKNFRQLVEARRRQLHGEEPE
jgi:hypothetical protein